MNQDLQDCRDIRDSGSAAGTGGMGERWPCATREFARERRENQGVFCACVRRGGLEDLRAVGWSVRGGNGGYEVCVWADREQFRRNWGWEDDVYGGRRVLEASDG